MIEYTERLCRCGKKIRSGKQCLECLQEKIDQRDLKAARKHRRLNFYRMIGRA